MNRNKENPNQDGKQLGPVANQQATGAQEIQNEQGQLYIIMVIGRIQGKIGRMPMKPKKCLKWQDTLSGIESL